MKKTLLTILALLCIVGSLAKGKDVVWEKPNAICNIFRTGTRFKVNRMELEEPPFPVRKRIAVSNAGNHAGEKQNNLAKVIIFVFFSYLCKKIVEDNQTTGKKTAPGVLRPGRRKYPRLTKQLNNKTTKPLKKLKPAKLK